MTSKRKKYYVIGWVIVALLILVFAVPPMINVNRYRPQITAKIEQATGKPAKIGHLSFTVFPHLAVAVDDFSLGNPPGFPAGNLVQAKRLYAELNIGALLHRRIEISSIDIDKPEVHLLSRADGRWNFQKPPEAPTQTTQPPATSSKTSSFLPQEISDLKMTGGSVTVANLLASGAAGPAFVEGHGLNCHFQDIDLVRLQSTAQAAASHVRQLLPKSRWRLVPVVYAENSSPEPVAHGTLGGDALRFGQIEATSIKADARVFPKKVFLDNLGFNLADGSATGNLSADLSQPDLAYKINTAFHGVNLSKLLQAFPKAQGKITGTMEGDFNMAGQAVHSADPLSGLQGTGQIKVHNGRLPSLTIKQSLLSLARFVGVGAGSGDPSAFSLISADLNLANEKLTSQNIRFVGDGIGLNAAGNVLLSGNGNMNYAGIATIAARQNSVMNVLARATGVKFENGHLAVPFSLGGTLQNPSFALRGSRAPAQSATAGQQSAPARGASILQGLGKLFGKKKR